MQILTFIVVMGIALVIFYLFLKKVFNEARFNLPEEKQKPEDRPKEPGKNIQPGGKQQPPEKKPQGPEEKHQSPEEKQQSPEEKQHTIEEEQQKPAQVPAASEGKAGKSSGEQGGAEDDENIV